MRKCLPTITIWFIVGMGWMMAVAHEEKPIEWSFDKDAVGKAPAGWKIASPSPAEGKSAWTVVADPSAPTPPNVFSLTVPEGTDSGYNLAMAEKIAVKDVDLSVKLRANGGKNDQGGGLIWRYKDEKNYYVCRINPLEGNYRVYKVVDGKRTQLQSADVNTDSGKWYTLRVVMTGNQMICYLDGQKLLEASDDTFKDAGLVGLWTKADAATSFDNVVAAPAATNDGAALLNRVRVIPLPGIEGRMDHMTLDATGQRLFLAALGNNTVEVVDLREGVRTRQLHGTKEPQGVVLIKESNRLVVASGEDGKCRFYDASPSVIGTVDGLDDADNVRYEREHKHIYVGYGKGALAVIDADGMKKIADIPLAGHPESFQLEAKGTRIFVNVPTARYIAVIDREKRAVVATWAITEVEQNYPMALDEANHRLFVGCRKPAKMLVLDTQTGRTITAYDCCGDADDVFYDAGARRIYVSGGEGCISVFQQESADTYREAGRVPTAPGARTSLFVPETRTLYLAVPHRGEQQAEIRVFTASSPKP